MNRRIDGDVLLLAFSGLILRGRLAMVTACPSCTRAGEARELATRAARGATAWTPKRTVARARRVGTGVGFLTGLFGVGGGFVIVPALTLVMGFAMPEAIGTSLLVVAINSAIALLARARQRPDRLDRWRVPSPRPPSPACTSGGRLAGSLEPERSLRAFAAGLILLAFYSATRALTALI